MPYIPRQRRIGEDIKRLLHEQGWTQDTLAQALGVSTRMLNGALNVHIGLSVKNWERLVELLDHDWQLVPQDRANERTSQ